MDNAEPGFFESFLPTIFPYVVPRSFIEHVTPDAVVGSPFSYDVHMILVESRQGTVRNIRPEELAAMGLSQDNAFDIAAENLAEAWHAGEFDFGIATLLDGVKVGGGEGKLDGTGWSLDTWQLPSGTCRALWRDRVRGNCGEPAKSDCLPSRCANSRVGITQAGD